MSMVLVTTGGPVAVPSRPKAPAVRLTRRGRWVMTSLMVGGLLLGATAVAGGSEATVDPGPAPATRTVVVSEGDTLWDIASDVASPGRTQAVINDIEQLNHLSGPMLVEGQTLVVPLGG